MTRTALRFADLAILFALVLSSSYGSAETAGTLAAAPPEGWFHKYLVGAEGGALDVVQLADGSYVTGGWYKATSSGTSDQLFMKVDAAGSPTSVFAYSGPSREEVNDLEPTSDGGFVTIGLTTSFGAPHHEPLVVKLDAAGNQVWAHYYRSSGRDWGNAIEQTSDGGYVFAGLTDPCACGGATHAAVIKLDTDGTPIWQTFFGSDASLTSVHQT